jgi:hypothetical protein
VSVELKKDLIQVRYDAARVTPKTMLSTVDKEGFQAKVIAGPVSTGTP